MLNIFFAMLYMQKIAPRFRMPTISELRKFIRENRDGTCAPYSKLKKAELLERAIAAGYVVEDRPAAARKRRVKAKKPEVKKPEVSEVQTVKKTKKMKPQEIKGEEDVINPDDKIAKQLQPIMKEFNEKYSKEAIKREYLTRENVEEFTDPAFALMRKINELQGQIEDPVIYIKKYKNDQLGTYSDNERNFVRRVKARVRAVKKIEKALEPEAKKPEVKKPEVSEVQKVKKTKKMKPQEIKSEEEVIKKAGACEVPSYVAEALERPKTVFHRFYAENIEKLKKAAEFLGEPFVYWEIAMKDKKPSEKSSEKDYYRDMRLRLHHLRIDMERFCKLRQQYDDVFGQGALISWREFKKANPEEVVGHPNTYYDIKQRELEEHASKTTQPVVEEKKTKVYPIVLKKSGKFDEFHGVYSPEHTEARADAEYYSVPFEMWKNLSEEQKESVKNMREGEKTREEEKRRAKLREAPPGLALRTAEAQERGLEDIDPIKERDSLDQSLHNVFNEDWMKLTDQALPLYTEGGKGFKTVKKYYEHIGQKLEQGKSAKWIYDRYKDKFEDATGDILPWWGYTDMSLPPDEFYNSIMGDMDFYDETEEKPEEWEDDICRMKPLEIPKFNENQRFNKKQVEQIANVARSMGYNFVLWENSNEKRWGWKKGDYYRAMLEELPAFKYDVEMYCKLREEYNDAFGSDALRPWREYRLDHPNVPAKDYYRTIQRELEPYAMEPID